MFKLNKKKFLMTQKILCKHIMLYIKILYKHIHSVGIKVLYKHIHSVGIKVLKQYIMFKLNKKMF
jgi:hypothetical protein